MAFGILQIVVYLVLLGLIAKPLGTYMAHVYKGERTFLHPGPAAGRALHLPRLRRGREARDGPRRLHRRAPGLQLHRPPVHLRDPSAAGRPAAQPCARARHDGWDAFNTAVSFVTNTNWQVYVRETSVSYLTQMVGLAWQNFVSAAVGHGGRGGLRPRTDAAVDPRARQLLGRPHAQLPLRPAADLHRRRPPSRLAGRRPEPRRADAGQDPRRRRADHRPRPGRLTGDHQGARDQRRRLLQRQLGAPVREPDPAHQPPRDAGDPRHPGGLHLHVRQVRRRQAAGVGALRGRHGARGPERRASSTGASRSATRTSPGPEPTRPPPSTQAGGNMEGKEVRFGIARPRCSRTSPRRHRAAPSTRRTTA